MITVFFKNNKWFLSISINEKLVISLEFKKSLSPENESDQYYIDQFYQLVTFEKNEVYNKNIFFSTTTSSPLFSVSYAGISYKPKNVFQYDQMDYIKASQLLIKQFEKALFISKKERNLLIELVNHLYFHNEELQSIFTNNQAAMDQLEEKFQNLSKNYNEPKSNHFFKKFEEKLITYQTLDMSQNTSLVPKEAIPKRMIYIWYGSVIPEDELNNLKKWMKHVPTWQHLVVYDPELLSENENHSIENLANEIGFDLVDINQLTGHEQLAKLGKMVTSGPFRNYALRSDIDRIRMLIHLGGLYVDIGDVMPSTSMGDDKHNNFPRQLFAKHGVLFHFNAFCQPYELSILKGDSFNNDILASIPGSEILKTILQTMARDFNYDAILDSLNNLISNARDVTLIKTGPTFLALFLNQSKDMNIVTLDSSKKNIETFDLAFSIDVGYFQTFNKTSWLSFDENNKPKLPRHHYDNRDEHFKDIQKRVSLEKELFGKSLKTFYLYDFIQTQSAHPSKESFKEERFIRTLLNIPFLDYINNSKAIIDQYHALTSPITKMIFFHHVTQMNEDHPDFEDINEVLQAMDRPSKKKLKRQ